MKSKYIMLTATLMLLCLLFTGCGSSGPKDADIKADVASAIMDTYGGDYVITEYEVVQSKTEDDYYFASIQAAAEGKYARLNLTGEVYYSNYDQGWMLDSAYVYAQDYTIIYYPSDTSEIAAMLGERNNNRPWPATFENASNSENKMIWNCSVEAPCNDYFTMRCDQLTICWAFSLEENDWVIENESGAYYCSFNPAFNIEGEWKTNGNSHIMIQNQTETSMEVYDTNEPDDGWIYVELVTGGLNIPLTGEQIPAVYRGYAPDSEQVEVTILKQAERKISVTIDHQYQMFDRTAFITFD